MRFKIPFLTLAVTLLLVTIIQADPYAPDTVYFESKEVNVGDDLTVGVSISVDEWLTGIEITLTWDWPELLVDSVEFDRSGFPAATLYGYVTYQNTISLLAFPSGTELIAPGKNRWAILHFSNSASTSSRQIRVDSTTVYLSDSLIVRSTQFSDTLWPGPFGPQVVAGIIDLVQCCEGHTGNVDCDAEGKANLADITVLISHVYISKQPLCCRSAANTSGDLEGKLNLADITRLIDHVYISREPATPCQ